MGPSTITDAGPSAGLQQYCKSFGSSHGSRTGLLRFRGSSFQLDGTLHFQPHIAVITNITQIIWIVTIISLRPISPQMSITKSQGQEDFLIYDADDPV